MVTGIEILGADGESRTRLFFLTMEALVHTRITGLVAQSGLEPETPAYETSVKPLHYRAMEHQRGFEPLHRRYEGQVPPSGRCMLVTTPGVEPDLPPYERSVAPLPIALVVGPAGFEPAIFTVS